MCKKEKKKIKKKENRKNKMKKKGWQKRKKRLEKNKRGPFFLYPISILFFRHRYFSCFALYFLKPLLVPATKKHKSFFFLNIYIYLYIYYYGFDDSGEIIFNPALVLFSYLSLSTLSLSLSFSFSIYLYTLSIKYASNCPQQYL